MHTSCALACHFAEQGLKIRIRKESRKRSAAQKFRRIDQSTSAMDHNLVQQQAFDEDSNMEEDNQIDTTMMGMMGQRGQVYEKHNVRYIKGVLAELVLVI